MKLTHHGLHVELPDEWWVEAEMMGFVPKAATYRVDRKLFKDVKEVRIDEVAPGHRNPGVCIFNDSEDSGTAHERVLRILRGFRLDSAIPPVEIVDGQYPYRYKLTHGAHRFYCSLAAGFTSVPAIEGFDWNNKVG